MNYTNGTVELINKALKVGTLPLVFKKIKGNWVAVVPAKISKDGAPEELSKVTLLDWNRSGLRQLKHEASGRYLATVFEDSMVCYVNLRWAMKLPNWAGTPYGALRELSNAMKRAGLI
jgi:hypothetical protein